MCIAVIKKIEDSNYKYVISFNRDEKKGKPFKLWGYYWDDNKEIYGCFDEDTQGTWFAINENNVVAFLLNREITDKNKEYKSRGRIILEVLKDTETAREAESKVHNLNLDNIRPFNLVVLDFKNVYYLRFYKQIITSYELKQSLILLNRSYPNDLNEARIRNNYGKFLRLTNKNLLSNSWWNVWKQLLLDGCFCENAEDEKKMFLISSEWCTLSSTMVVLNVDRKYDIFKTIYG